MASTGSTHDDDALIERVAAVRPDGVELDYDLPADTSPESRASQWLFPARVFKPNGAKAQLLDRPAMQARLAAWLRPPP